MSHITYTQRYTISVMLEQGYSQKDIARTIKKDKSVVSREIRRNRNPKTGRYTYKDACRRSAERKVPSEREPCKLAYKCPSVRQLDDSQETLFPTPEVYEGDRDENQVDAAAGLVAGADSGLLRKERI